MRIGLERLIGIGIAMGGNAPDVETSPRQDFWVHGTRNKLKARLSSVSSQAWKFVQKMLTSEVTSSIAAWSGFCWCSQTKTGAFP